jgi:hypothetical protein
MGANQEKPRVPIADIEISGLENGHGHTTFLVCSLGGFLIGLP